MLEKMGHIKNPLTIIAIFAGIAEVCGSGVLPFIEKDNQLIFIYFLISFPALLVLLFFLTLNFNNKALYAPSDYKDEENFIKISRFDLSRLGDVETKFDTPKLLGEYFERVESKINSVQDIVAKQFQMYYSNSEQNQKLISKRDELVELMKRNYLVSITSFENVEPFVHILREHGYSTEIYDGHLSEDRIPSFDEHKSIWLGKKVPLEVASDIIAVSKKYYKQLEYIIISGDLNDKDKAPEYIHSQIYIGGSTKTAVQRNVKPLSDADFALIREMRSIDDLHKHIRSFYPNGSFL